MMLNVPPEIFSVVIRLGFALPISYSEGGLDIVIAGWIGLDSTTITRFAARTLR